MRIKHLRVSGFRCLPFCAEFEEPQAGNSPAQIRWEAGAFCLAFPTTDPMLSAIIGPNSSGKSTVLYALDLFFGSKSKLPSHFFNGKSAHKPIIVEVDFRGAVEDPGEWHSSNCRGESDALELTVAKVWAEGRTTYIRRADGEYHKAGKADTAQLDSLLPEYRLISADARLSDEVNPEKKNLVTDLIQGLLWQSEKVSNRSILHKLRRVMGELEKLVDRSNPPNSVAWREIEALEEILSDGISHVVPGNTQVRLHVTDSLPSLEQMLLKGRFRIRDDVELDFEEQGLGLQRSFVISVLNAWCQYAGCRQEDNEYVFALEEPEIYLHPHATRVLLNVLSRISRSDQVIFSSHSPEFINLVPLDNIANIRRVGDQREVVTPDLPMLSSDEKTKIQRYLREERGDMLFARAVLLVEGQAEMFAIPGLARRIGKDLDQAGVSVVFVNGKGNFKTYHNILQAFGIPHVILADGDGDRENQEQRYEDWAAGVYVLDEDFEYLLAETVDEPRLLEIVNACRVRRGTAERTELPCAEVTSANLKSHWWQDLKESLHRDIANEHRATYKAEKEELGECLQKLADAVIVNAHVLPTGVGRRRSLVLKKEGKALVGRVVAELLTEAEIERMTDIVSAIDRVVDLAGASDV